MYGRKLYNTLRIRVISQLMYEIITWMISVDFSSSNAFAFDVIDSPPYYPAIKTVWSWKKKTKAVVGRLYVVHTTAEQILGTFSSNDYSSKKLHLKTKIWVMVTIVRLLLHSGILPCWQGALQMDC